MELEMLPGKMLVSRDPIEDRSAGGIIYPDLSQKLACTGVCHLHTPGDYWTYWEGPEHPGLGGRRVAFEKWGGRPLTIQGIEFWIIPETSCLGVEEEQS
jgi:co-chaperonin GroES (HSP10)